VADDLFVIRTFSDATEANLAEAVLEANGIPSTTISDDAGGMMPWLHALHPIRLMVRKSDVEIALALLQGTPPPPIEPDPEDER
jgi:hypothetical protein